MIVLAISMMLLSAVPEGSRARYDACVTSSVNQLVRSRADVLTVVNQGMARCSKLFAAAAQEMVEDAAQVGALPKDLGPEGRRMLGACELASYTKDMSLRRVIVIRAKK